VYWGRQINPDDNVTEGLLTRGAEQPVVVVLRSSAGWPFIFEVGRVHPIDAGIRLDVEYDIGEQAKVVL
jgi:hypothetical protein